MSTTQRPRGPIGAEEQERFLQALRDGWSVKKAAELSGGRDRRAFNKLRETNRRFDVECEEAIELGLMTLRDEARRRAVDGVRDFRLDRDGNEHELVVYSDKLLELELKRRDFAYRERHTLELTGAGGGPVEIGMKVEHDFHGILATLEQAGVLTRGPAADAALAAPLPLLPAPADDEAVGGAGRAPLPPG